ncbi:hypothetical protein LIER_12216 [Lithospermum erythrorhizon]|uniref:Catechol oxidase n=1 Tax=Lithospermum erythrorhizon TaxID=34254 RepID=A0AAV3PS78_LITER
MASLLPTTTPTFPSHFTSSKKPSQILIHGNFKKNNNARHLPIRCTNNNNNNINNNNNPQSSVETLLRKLDRRDILLGLGGFYGAAANIGSSIADTVGTGEPIPYPDLTKCTTAYIQYDPTGQKENVEVPYTCCPPTPTTEIKPYKLPEPSVMRVRPAAHLVDDRYIEKYMKAVQAMKDLPESDPRNFKQQANIHCVYCNFGYPTGVTGDDGNEIRLQVHHSWLFYPFHRWYLYFYERILGKLIDDPTFALPFWNWDTPCGMTMPHMFTTKNSPLDPDNASKPNPLYNEKRNEAHYPPAILDLGLDLSGSKVVTSDIHKVCNNLALVYRSVVNNGFDAVGALGGPYYYGSDLKSDGSLELLHNMAHIFVGKPANKTGNPPTYGEDMGNLYSAGKEPLFYCHHGNVDRMWRIWQDLGGKNFNNKAWLDSQFFFYDEDANPVYVTVKDCLDEKKMGYTYQPVTLPWRLAKPVPKTIKSDVGTTSTSPSVATVFPATLDKVVKALVQRPQISRTEGQKKKKQEILVIDGIQLPLGEFVKFDIFINDDDEKGANLSKAEFAGTFTSLPHGATTSSGHASSTTSFRIGLNEILEDLLCEGDEKIQVTLIPKAGCEMVTVDYIKVDFA